MVGKKGTKSLDSRQYLGLGCDTVWDVAMVTVVLCVARTPLHPLLLGCL